VEKHEQGYDIVYGERVDRDESKLLKRARKFFYRLLRAVADEEILLDMAEFSLSQKKFAIAILDENTSFPFLRASIARVGFRPRAIPFKRQNVLPAALIQPDEDVSLCRRGNSVCFDPFSSAAHLPSPGLASQPPLSWCGLRSTHSPWMVVAAFLLFAAYTGATMAFTAMYVARAYKNGLHRPNAFIDRSRSVLQPTRPDAEMVAREPVFTIMGRWLR